MINKKAYKSSSGITIVALVITIIVLIILSGITISALTRDDSVTNQAIEARESADYKEAKTEVNEEWFMLQNETRKKEFSNDEMAEKLEERLNNRLEDEAIEGEATVTYEKEQKRLKVENYKVKDPIYLSIEDETDEQQDSGTIEISTQPQNIEVLEGDGGSFSVTATTQGTATYQWYYNKKNNTVRGEKIAGATQSTLSIPQTTLANDGYYYCEISTNNNGTNTAKKTKTAKLTVKEAIKKVTISPAELTISKGKTLKLEASTSGGGEITYQWFKSETNSNEGGVQQTDATTNTSFEKANAQETDAGYYYCIATQTYGTSTRTATSDPVKVQWKEIPELKVTFNPRGNSTPSNEASTSVTIVDEGNIANESSFKYLWTTRTSGVTVNDFTGSNSGTFTQGATINLPDNNSGDYYLYIYAEDNEGGYILEKSDVFVVGNIQPGAEITLTPSTGWVNTGTTVTINPYAITVTYDENNIRRETHDPSRIAKVTVNGEEVTLTNGEATYTAHENGEYKIEVTDIYGNKWSETKVIDNIDNTLPTIHANNITYGQDLSINIEDAGSGVKAWKVTNSSTAPTEGWTEFGTPVTSTETPITVPGLTPGTWYIWAKDDAGNVKSEQITVSKASNPITSANIETQNVESTINLSSYITNSQGNVTYEIVATNNEITTTSTLNTSTGELTLGTLSTLNDDDQTITIRVTAAGNENYESKSIEIPITVQKYTRTLEWADTALTSVTYLDTSKYSTVNVTGGTNGTTGEVTYTVTTNNASKLSINSTTGQLTPLAYSTGETVAATMARTSTVKQAELTRSIAVARATGILTLGLTNGTESYTGNAVYGTAQHEFKVLTNHGGNLSVSNTGAASTSLSATTGTPNVTISNLSTISTGTQIVVTVTSSQTDQYNEISKTYTLTIEQSEGGITLSPSSVTAKTTTTVNNISNYVQNSYGTLSYEIKDADNGTKNVTGGTASTVNSSTGVVTLGEMSSQNDNDVTVKVTVHDSGDANHSASEATFTITVQKHTRTITFTNVPDELAYNKTVTANVEINGAGGTASTEQNIIYTTQTPTVISLNGTTLKAVASSGTSKITATLPRTTTVKETTVEKTITATKATMEPAPTVTISGYKYAGTISTPTINNNIGEGAVTYYYNTSNSNTGGTEWSNQITSTTLNAGTYYMYAVIAETTNYSSYTTDAVQFTIEKANNPITITNPNTQYTGATVNLAQYINNAQGEVSFAIKTNGTTSPSELNGSNLTLGAMSNSSDANQTVVVTATVGGNTNYKADNKDITIEIQKHTLEIEFVSPTSDTLKYNNTANAGIQIKQGTQTGGTATPVANAEFTSGTTSVITATGTKGKVLTAVASSGTSVITATLPRTATVKQATTTKTITATKANITPTLTMTGYTYGGTKSEPSISGNLGNGTVTYYYNTTNSTTGGTAWSTVTDSSTLQAGNYYIYATIAETTNYNSATTDAVAFTVSPAGAQLVLASSETTAYTGQTINISEFVTSHQGALSYAITSSTTTSTSTLNGSNITLGAMNENNDEDQEVVITITAAATGNYSEESKTLTITVQKYTRTLAFTSAVPASMKYNDTVTAGVNISGSGGTAGSVTYTTNNSNVITVNGTTLKAVAASGNATITATMARTTTVKEATATKTITATKADNPISIPAGESTQAISATYSTSAQDKAFTGATDAQGAVTYTIKSQKDKDDNDVTYFSIPTASNTSLQIAANTPVNKSVYKVVITATAAGNDNYNSESVDITLNITMNKQNVEAPSNVTISTAGRVTWGASSNATGYEISIDNTNWQSATSGINYLDSITNGTGSRTVYVRGINTETANYETNSTSVASRETTVYTVNFASNNTTMGTVNVANKNVIAGTTITANNNILKLQGITTGTTTEDIVTVTATNQNGYRFSKWSWPSTEIAGSINETLTITANFARLVYTITLDNQGATTAGTATIYEKYNTGYYTDSNCTTQMTTTTNPITIPIKTGYAFNGYYTAVSGGTPYIDNTGKLTSYASATNFYEDGKLYAQWDKKYYSITSGNTTNYYSDLATAVGAATDGQTIKLLDNVTDKTNVSITKNVYLDLQTYTITRNNNKINVDSGKSFTITGSTSGDNTGTITSTATNTIAVTNGTLNVNSGNIASTNSSGSAIYNNGANAVTNIGDANTSVNNTSPIITGELYGINNELGKWTYKNGIMQGKTLSFYDNDTNTNGGLEGGVRQDYIIVLGTNGDYKQAHLEKMTDVTTPWLPVGASYTNQDLNTGVTMKDSQNNEWTWVVVPKTITAGVNAIGANEDPTDSALETALVNYAATLVTNIYNYKDIYYSDDVTGLNEIDYNNKKRLMLNAIKENGGYWIGKYEAGYLEEPTESNYDKTTRIAVIQKDAYPYNYITSADSERKSEVLARQANGNGSLLFGTQWDLTLGYLVNRGGVSQRATTDNSINWGNYKNASFTIESAKAKYKSSPTSWPTISGTKSANTSQLLTTGAANNRNGKLNIIDLAGNIWKWTLEYSLNSDQPAVCRSGSAFRVSSLCDASSRASNTTDTASDTNGFRPALYVALESAPTASLTTESYNGTPYTSGEYTEEDIYVTINNTASSNVEKYQYSKDGGETWADMPETNVMEDYTLTNGTAKFKITKDIVQEYQVRAILEDGNETASTSFTINKKTYNYRVGDTEYDTLAEAYAGAKQQGRSDITVLRNVTDSTTLTLDTRDVNLDLQSYTITRNSGIITVANGKTMTITGSTSGNNTGTITSTNQSTITVTEGTLNINSGNIVSTHSSGRAIYNNGKYAVTNIGDTTATLSTTSPLIQGGAYGIYNNYNSNGAVKWTYANGKLQGGTSAFYDNDTNANGGLEGGVRTDYIIVLGDSGTTAHLERMTDVTTPWLPVGASYTNTDLNTGVTMKDSYDNEWTWVVVPKTITAGVSAIGANEDPTDSALETALKNYAATWVRRSENETDEWCSEEQSGMTLEEYTIKKRQMLNAIKEFGGYWIGKYESGYLDMPTEENYNKTTRTAVIQKDAYPYNNITCANSEKKSEVLARQANGTGSLLFGTQWDLTLGYLVNRGGVSQRDYCNSWGNCNLASFKIESPNAKRMLNYEGTHSIWESIRQKDAGDPDLLTTGAANSRNGKLNVVDLLGNVWEWTEESRRTSRG